MLDYSDEEAEARAVRRRIRPLENSPGVFTPTKFLRGTGTRTNGILDFKFQSFEGGASGMIAPAIIAEYIPRRNVQTFDLDLKGNKGWIYPSDFDQRPSSCRNHPDSFFRSMKSLVFLGEFLGVMPVSGIRGSNYENISFKWIHYKTLYWFLTFVGTVFCFLCCTIYGLNNEGFTQAASEIVYFACGVFSSLLMLNLGRNWKKVNKEFADMELKLKKYGYPKNMNLKFKGFTILVLLVAVVEHLLGKSKNIELASVCARRKDNIFSLAESFFVNEYPEVFSLFPYNFYGGISVLTAHFLTTANWNIKDIFLCLISWSIGERFRQIHELLDKVHGQEKPISFWKEVREDYNTVSVATKRVDAHIQKLMLLSIGNNLFFICIQLLHSLKRKITSFKIVYFFWSFGFLVLRTCFVAFSAARINDESKEPKTVLYSVPHKNYSAEVRRFLTQLTTNEVALTGSGFFSVTRSLILTITGTVITYEIVLVQFSGSEIEEGLKNNQTMCLRF